MRYILALIVLAVTASPGFAQTPERRGQARQRRPLARMRAEAPKEWDRASQAVFADDAFTVVGERRVVIAPPAPAPPKPAPPKSFDRSAVMKVLKQAEEDLSAVLADEKGFHARRGEFDKTLQVLVANAESLVKDDSEYKDDETYMDLAMAFRERVKSVPDAIKTAGYGEGGKAFGKLKQACNDCHEKYR